VKLADKGVRVTIATEQKLLLTITEAARVLSMSRDSIYKLLWRDSPEGLRTVKVGRRRLIPVAECRRWIDHQLGDALPPVA
jgi:excisionase family DNA binding protein